MIHCYRADVQDCLLHNLKNNPGTYFSVNYCRCLSSFPCFQGTVIKHQGCLCTTGILLGRWWSPGAGKYRPEAHHRQRAACTGCTAPDPGLGWSRVASGGCSGEVMSLLRRQGLGAGERQLHVPLRDLVCHSETRRPGCEVGEVMGCTRQFWQGYGPVSHQRASAPWAQESRGASVWAPCPPVRTAQKEGTEPCFVHLNSLSKKD